MGKVKLRVSSILPDSLSKWFSPTADPNAAGAAAVAGEESSSSTSPQLPLSQHNGSALTTTIKQKHSRRRIQLEADDAPDIAVDDGTNAQDLNEEEVQLADNIAEHDLAGEDEQTRRSEYNVSLLRKRQLVANEDDDDDDDDDAEEEDDDEADDGPQQLNYRSQQPNRSVNFRSSAAQPLQKRKRIEPMESTFSPQFNAQRRRPQLHASTPAASDALRSQAPPNRFSTHLNLYGHQRQREPAYNFMSAGNNSSSEAAVATSGDLPMSSRRSLNIAPMTERREMALPSYRRQSLLGHRGLMPNWRSYQTISEVPNEEQQQQQQQQQTMRQETNNNNNNNIIQTKRSGGTDSQSECESNESHAAGGSGFGCGRMHNLNNNNNINSNSNQLFYGNLQSRKSVFNTNVNATSLLQHHNSTLSLNSLNHRRRFNASIYGSTSALSDSRLLSSSMSGNSPFYQGPTAFGGSSANNRYFSQGNLPINSGSSSPAPSNSDSVCSNSNPARPNICHSSYGMKPIEMRPRGNLCTGAGDGSANVPGLSLTAQRILNLLENHTTPLMDAKKMGSTLREHQLQRSSRHLTAGSKPYSYPNHTLAFGYNNTAGGSNNNRNSDPDNSSKLLVPTMLQLLERRRLHRVAPSTRALVDAKQLEEQQMLHQQHQQAASLAANSNTTVTVTPTGSQTHTNKMRSRLSHQLRKDARIVDEQQLPPAPLDLPNIRFPVMASEPTFDLVIAPPPPMSTAATTAEQQQQLPKLNNNNKTNNNTNNNNNNNNNNSSSMRRRGHSSTRYQFANPQPLNCADPAGTTATPQKRMKHNFIFDPPIPLDESTKCLPNSLQFNGATCNSNLKSTGSVIDILLPPKRTDAPASPAAAAPASAPLTTVGFGDQFKKSASEWECEACMLRNKQELNKCVACETPKPKPKGAANTAASGPTAPAINYPAEDETARLKTTSLGTQVCMSSIAQNSGSNSSSFGSSNSNSFPSGFGDAFKPPANMWECGCCMIMNPASLNECLACQSPNPKSSNSNSNSNSSTNNNNSNNSNSNNSFKFGFDSTAVVQPKADAGFQQLIAAQKSSSWNCEACMAQNDISRNKCICCEQLKPGATVEEASTTAAVPKFMFGFPAKAATTATTEAGATTTAATATVAPVTQFTAATPFANNPATSVATSSTTLPIFGSNSSQGSNLFGSSNTATKTTNAMQPLAVSSPFGMATTTTSAATAAAATVQPNTGGNGTISALFGNFQSTKRWQPNAESTPQDTRTDASPAAAVEMESGAAAAAAAAAAANNDRTEQQWTTLGHGLGRGCELGAAEQQQLRHNDSQTTTTIHV
ncbi:uncharacterized protein Dvir_GJ14813 [Drosophila virilis]|uniref:Nuclear pore complex protein Nup153 n=1 Tax=Drosophila virilis TaxID=7244 RepID=B4MEH1_DROVI|nr:uncharacterized protein Dvir_GJ14813 [Drosophila virilis]